MLNPDDIRYLVVHCTDTSDDKDLSIADIHKMHLGFGWHGIGYHRLIRRDGSLELGRPECWIGAHVYGFNEVSLGVCLVGREHFSETQFDTLDQTLKYWLSVYPDATICGHRDFEYTEKTCPNFNVAEWLVQRGISNHSRIGDYGIT